jgi:hypothetical protein
MQLVVVSAVAAAVMAATITFNSTSQKRLLFIVQNNFIIFQGAWGKGQENRLCAAIILVSPGIN